ncbi:hypothetical protein ACMATS_37955 (plasmid) [Streptoverticillium reticulum]|uniref:hypothetical protein n=1 Tax=Streptoverticillium reticulum TaxID=1433415 RepID=UPI0039BF64BB
MASSPFTHRPATPDPETWTPEGTIVVQRYRALEGATVLVYTASGERGTSFYAAACLGCTFRAAKTTAHNPMSEQDAAAAANAHAAGCRAMPRGVPAAPDGDQAATIVRSRLWSKRTYSDQPHIVNLSDFHQDRVDLRRPADFIKRTMLQLVDDEPDFLTTEPCSSGTGTRFLVQPHPSRS